MKSNFNSSRSGYVNSNTSYRNNSEKKSKSEQKRALLQKKQVAREQSNQPQGLQNRQVQQHPIDENSMIHTLLALQIIANSKKN